MPPPHLFKKKKKICRVGSSFRNCLCQDFLFTLGTSVYFYLKRQDLKPAIIALFQKRFWNLSKTPVNEFICKAGESCSITWSATKPINNEFFH